MELIVYLLALTSSGLAQQWVENGEYEYYYDSSDQARVFSYDEAESKCAEQNAILVTIKTKEVEDFILAQRWQSQCLKIYHRFGIYSLFNAASDEKGKIIFLFRLF